MNVNLIASSALDNQTLIQEFKSKITIAIKPKENEYDSYSEYDS